MPAPRVLSVFFIAACTVNDITVRTSAIDNRSQSDTGDDYEFAHVSAESYTLQKPGFYAVHGAGDWTSMFKEDVKGNRPPVPNAIDFQKQMLFVATSKTPGAKTIEVQKITRTFDGLHIYVLETLTPENCPAQAALKGPPMDIVSLDNVKFDMHVVYDRVHADSCGPPPDAVVACRVAGSGQAGADRIAASMGETIDCDSNQSKAQTGTIVERRWELKKPPGSSSKVVIGKENIGITFPIDAWGAYQIELGVRDSTRDGTGLGVVEVLPPNAGVQLYWTREDADPKALPRVELHVIDLGSWSDCNAKMSKPWCEVKVTGALQQAAISPQENHRYKVQVRYLDARLPGSPGICVRAFGGKGARPQSSCDGEDVQRGKNALWELGALDIPHAVFYDARLPKPPEPQASNADAGAPASTLTNVVIPPPPPPATTRTAAPPPPPPPPATTSTATIEL
jgi:hypothetical protein